MRKFLWAIITNYYSRARKFREAHENLTVANISRREPIVLKEEGSIAKIDQFIVDK
jgi:hypothetical protein